MPLSGRDGAIVYCIVRDSQSKVLFVDFIFLKM